MLRPSPQVILERGRWPVSVPPARAPLTSTSELLMVRPSLRSIALVVTCGLGLVGPAGARAQSPEAQVVATIDAFHAALVAGDSATALSLLADDVTILESGGVEDKEHYRSGHLAGDMRFARAVPRERGEIRVRIVGEVAWAWSTSVTQGRMGERDIDAQGAELMVLSRAGEGWTIRAIHWSSRDRRR